MKKETAITRITRRDENGERVESIEVTQEEFNQIVSKYSNGRSVTRRMFNYVEQALGEEVIKEWDILF